MILRSTMRKDASRSNIFSKTAYVNRLAFFFLLVISLPSAFAAFPYGGTDANTTGIEVFGSPTASNASMLNNWTANRSMNQINQYTGQPGVLVITDLSTPGKGFTYQHNLSDTNGKNKTEAFWINVSMLHNNCQVAEWMMDNASPPQRVGGIWFSSGNFIMREDRASGDSHIIPKWLPNVTTKVGVLWYRSGATLNVSIFINGTKVADQGMSALTSEGYFFKFGEDAQGSETSCGIEVHAWAATNNSVPFNFTIAAVAPAGQVINLTVPELNISYPYNGETLDNSTLFPIRINGTVGVVNGTVNISINDSNWRNVGNATNFNFTINGTYRTGLWSVMLNATNKNFGNSTTYILNFTLDIDNPTVQSSFDLNKSLFYIYQNQTIELNYTDNVKLFSINMSNREAGLVFERTNINSTSFQLNFSFNSSNYTLGKHNLTLSVCDAHTRVLIGNYDNTRNESERSIRFNFGEDFFSIRPLDSSLVEQFEAQKLQDRYTFTYTKNSSRRAIQRFVFVVASSQKIDIIGNEKGYNGWLVIGKLNKWVDFNTNLPGLTYDIQRVTDRVVLVEINGISSDTFTFNSAGDLNCLSKDVSYFLFNYTAIFSSTVVETTQDFIKLAIDFRDVYYNGNGTLNYAGTNYSTRNSTSPNQLNLTLNLTIPAGPSNSSNLSFFWYFNLNESSFITMNYTQLVNRIQLTECGSLTNVPTINISIFNEQASSQYLESEVAGTFRVWTNDSANYLNFTFNLFGETNYTLCIFPNTSLSVNSDLFYNTSGGFRERWFLRNARISTNTTKINLFNFNSQTGVSEVDGTLRDSSYSQYPNIIAQLFRFYPAENIWRNVQQDQSDDFGQVVFHVIENSENYRIYYFDEDEFIDSTETIKFVCTNGLCSLNFPVIDSNVNQTAKPVFQYSYDNASSFFFANFSDITGLTTSARLLVTKDQNTICDMTTTGNSGTLYCNTTGITGTLQARLYSSASPETPKIVVYINKVAQALYKVLAANGYQREGIFWATAISTTLEIAGFMFNPIAGIILYILSLVAVNYIGLANYITNLFITLMAVIGIVISMLLSKRRNT